MKGKKCLNKIIKHSFGKSLLLASLPFLSLLFFNQSASAATVTGQSFSSYTRTYGTLNGTSYSYFAFSNGEGIYNPLTISSVGGGIPPLFGYAVNHINGLVTNLSGLTTLTGTTVNITIPRASASSGGSIAQSCAYKVTTASDPAPFEGMSVASNVTFSTSASQIRFSFSLPAGLTLNNALAFNCGGSPYNTSNFLAFITDGNSSVGGYGAAWIISNVDDGSGNTGPDYTGQLDNIGNGIDNLNQGAQNRHDAEKQEEADRESAASESAGQSTGGVGFSLINPLGAFFGYSDGCVNVPTVANWLHLANSQVCPFFPQSVRNGVTPVISIFGSLLIFGFVYKWLFSSFAGGSD